MRILIDLQACQSTSRLGGIGRYSMNLVEALCRHCGSHELRILLNDRLPEAIGDIYRIVTDRLPRQQVQVFQVPGPLAAINPYNVSSAAELVYEYLLHRLAPDIIHISSLIEGLGDEVVSSVGRLVPARRISVTLYDLIPLMDPGRYLTDPVARNHYFRKIDDLKRAGMLLAISEYSRREAIEALGVDPGRIFDIGAGVDARFYPRSPDPGQAEKLRRAHGIDSNFLLFAGSFDIRKNHEGLIRAYARVPASVRQGHQLVVIGNGWPGKYAELRQIARRAGLGQRELVFTGRVSDSDLLTLYAMAELFVFPSLREGYGLPVLEAMACGLPTIASNATSLPEVVGWSEALFDPTDLDAMAAKIYQALTDEGFRGQLRTRGLAQSRRFTWDNVAKAAMKAFENQYERTRHLARQTPETLESKTLAALRRCLAADESCLAARAQVAAALSANARCLVEVNRTEPRIGWITTWNTRCGIACYARHLAGAALPTYTILAPMRDEAETPDEPNVIRCWRIGEDDLHDLATQVHLSDLDTLLIQFQYGFFDLVALRVFLQEMIGTGRRLFVIFHATTDTPNKSLAELRVPLRLCQRLWVHSANDEAALARIGLGENVARLPHGVIVAAPADVRIDIPPDRFVLATYGFFLPHKGLLEILTAVSDLCRLGWNLHLLMVNAEYPVSVSADLIRQARRRIADLGLADRVTLITDYLPDAESLGYLRRADLIVYPYQQTGESSSAAVRMGLAARRPVAVTPLPIFDDVRDIVLTLPGIRVQEMGDGLQALMADLQSDVSSESVRQTRARARRWCDDHGYPRLSAYLHQCLMETDR